jgi:hypothetical protein
MAEKVICRCGTEMDYDGLEPVVLADDNFENPVAADLEVFICPSCENKAWLHVIDRCISVEPQKPSDLK